MSNTSTQIFPNRNQLLSLNTRPKSMRSNRDSHTIGSNNEYDTPDKCILCRIYTMIGNAIEYTNLARTAENIHRYVHGNHLRLHKADRPSFSSKQSSHQTKPKNKKLTSIGFKQQLAPPLPNKKQNRLQNSLLRRTNSGSGKLLKTASLKRTS